MTPSQMLGLRLLSNGLNRVLFRARVFLFASK